LFFYIDGYIFSASTNCLTLKIIGQCDVKHIVTSPIKTITSVLNVSTYIINNIAAVGLAAILVIISVSTFKITIILYIPNALI
jgi:hypothetical protein